MPRPTDDDPYVPALDAEASTRAAYAAAKRDWERTRGYRRIETWAAMMRAYWRWQDARAAVLQAGRA